MRDLANNISVRQALVPAVKTEAGDGVTVDTLGFGSVAFIVNTGAVGGAGDFGVAAQQSDTTSGGDFGAVPAGNVDSNAPGRLRKPLALGAVA